MELRTELHSLWVTRRNACSVGAARWLRFPLVKTSTLMAVGWSAAPSAPPLKKEGLEPRGAALAIATGACISASYALLSDHDLQRTKKTVAGGALGFLGGYLFLRGSRFDDAQTAAVFGGIITLLSIGSYARYRAR